MVILFLLILTKFKLTGVYDGSYNFLTILMNFN